MRRHLITRPRCRNVVYPRRRVVLQLTMPRCRQASSVPCPRSHHRPPMSYHPISLITLSAAPCSALSWRSASCVCSYPRVYTSFSRLSFPADFTGEAVCATRHGSDSGERSSLSRIPSCARSQIQPQIQVVNAQPHNLMYNHSYNQCFT